MIADRSLTSATRQGFTWFAAVLTMIVLGRACQASTVFTDVSLIPASDGLDFLGYSANVISISDHNVFLERLGEPDPYVDHIRIVGESLDLPNGGTFWSFAESGTHYHAKSPLGLAGQSIPAFWAGQDPPVPGVPVASETFYLAFTEFWEDGDTEDGNAYLYGWVQLQLDPPLRSPLNSDGSNDLILLGGAYTNDPRGIIVGQIQAVPEVTSGVLASFTASLFAALALMKRKR